MPRQARIALPAMVYHVITRGNNRGWVFQDPEDFDRYLDTLRRFKAKYRFLLYHWVLMNNHVHLLMEPSGSGSLTQIMHGINLSFTLWFNRKYRRVGHLWQDRFKSCLVESDFYLLECGRYIERNPLRIGLVQDPGEYSWSSYRVHAGGQCDGLTDRHGLLDEQFGADGTSAYSSYVQDPREQEEEEMRGKMPGGIIGTHEFRGTIEAALQKVRRPMRGRPRKINL